VVLQLERLMAYPMVREAVEAGRLTLHGWHVVIEDGEVHVFDLAQGCFVAAAHAARRHRALCALCGGGPAAAGRLSHGRAPRAWRLRHLLAAPHRLCFAAGALLMTAQAGLWTLALAGRAAAGLPPTPPWLHALAATSGFPLFIAGFGLSAGARWLRQPVPATAPLGPPWPPGAWAGWACRWPDRAGSVRSRWAPPCWAAATCCAGSGAWCGRQSRPCSRRLDAVVRMLALGLLALAVAAAGLGGGQPRWVRMALLGLLWGSLLPAFAAAARRLVPWAARTGRPAGCMDADRRAGRPAGAGGRPAHPAWPLPLMGALTALAWGLGKAPPCGAGSAAGLPNRFVRLLARPAGPAPLPAQRWRWVGLPGAGMAAAGRAWQLAATHLLALGYLGGTALAMVSRVSATQSGQAQAVDGPAAGPGRPAGPHPGRAAGGAGGGGPLVPVAALWTLTTAGWSVWLLRWLGRLPAAPAAPSPVRVPPCANP
jgi:hypothetical protein